MVRFDYLATRPVFALALPLARVPDFCDIQADGNGRGERIRTSGPCLPKAYLLAALGHFPSFSLAMLAHIRASVLARFTAEVCGVAYNPCLSFGSRSRQMTESRTTSEGRFA